MKKTILIALFLGCLTSFASAGMKAGVTVSGYDLTLSGNESKTSGTDVQRASEEVQGATGSFFIEYSPDMLGNRISFGVDVVPYDIDMGSVSNVRTGGTLGNQNNQSGTNSASVEMEMPVTAYILIPTEQGLYLKAGASQANLSISESITTGSQYPDEEIYGFHANIGYEHTFDTMFVRGEVGYSEWVPVTVTSSSRRMTIEGEMDGTSARISIGTSF